MVVYPMPGRRVRCPMSSRPVPTEGLEVPNGDLFWTRRLRDQDVTLEPPGAEDGAPEAEAASVDEPAPLEPPPADAPPPAETEDHA